MMACKRLLKPGGRLVVADNDLSGWSCAIGKHDPLSVPLAWFVEAYIQDPYLVHKLPSKLHSIGLAPRGLQLHTVVDTTSDSYGYKHVMMSAIDAFSSSGCAGAELTSGFKAEVTRRLQARRKC